MIHHIQHQTTTLLTSMLLLARFSALVLRITREAISTSTSTTRPHLQLQQQQHNWCTLPAIFHVVPGFVTWRSMTYIGWISESSTNHEFSNCLKSRYCMAKHCTAQNSKAKYGKHSRAYNIVGDVLRRCVGSMNDTSSSIVEGENLSNRHIGI